MVSKVTEDSARDFM